MGRYSGKTCRLLFMLVLTVAFFVAELVSGYVGNSIALLSDSFNMLSDLISLCVGLGTGYLARRPPGGSGASYGYARAEVVGALSNAVFLAALCFTIFVEAVLRLARPERIDDPELVLIVGALGLAVNVLGLLIFQDCGACFARCAPRRRRHQRSPPGARPDAKDEKGATVIANVAGAFRMQPPGGPLSPHWDHPLLSLRTPSLRGASCPRPLSLADCFERMVPYRGRGFIHSPVDSLLLTRDSPPPPTRISPGVPIFFHSLSLHPNLSA